MKTQTQKIKTIHTNLPTVTSLTARKWGTIVTSINRLSKSETTLQQMEKAFKNFRSADKYNETEFELFSSEFWDMVNYELSKQ